MTKADWIACSSSSVTLLVLQIFSNQELNEVIATYKEAYPNHSERKLTEYLLSGNIYILRSHIGNSIHCIDPHGIEQQRLTTIHIEPTTMKDQTMCGT